MRTVEFTCMTTKQKFSVEDPEVCVMRNGKYQFKAPCPWDGKNGKKLTASKFCSKRDYEEYCARVSSEEVVETSDEQKSSSDSE